MRAETLAPAPVRKARARLREWVVTRPTVYYGLINLFRPRIRDCTVHRGTQIVIDGYGGSGNTFTEIAFRDAQPGPVELAHHLHTPAQIIRGVAWNIPTVVLLRDPRDAIPSGVSRRLVEFDDAVLSECLRNYTLFYETVLPYKNDVVTATFTDVTSDFGAVIEAVNDKFGSRFVPFEHTPENVAAIQSRQEQAKPGSRRPLDKREVRERLLSPTHAYDLDRALQAFNAFHP